ncbi:GNAT family N-acetyltransferase [Pedobacter yulinensis]|nr:GNAT family N-acetyltransferase [Pedobacter yulinensis]
MPGSPVSLSASLISVLCSSFADNQSVRAAMGDGAGKTQRLQALMEYALHMTQLTGRTYADATQQACALVTLSGQTVLFLQRARLDLAFIRQVCGWKGLLPLLYRNRKIASARLQVPHHYLWFLGVRPECQNQGRGTWLLQQILADASASATEVLLETSLPANLPFYERSGFQVYREIDVGYRLFFPRSGQ